MKLNPEQQIAVDHFNGPMLVTAVPGSGKSRALTERIIRLINRGVEPSNILSITFTNKASNEVRDRVLKRTGDKASKVWISTFHSLCVGLLRKRGSKVGVDPNFTIYADKEKFDLIRQAGRMCNCPLSGSKDPDIYKVSRLLEHIREDLVSIEDYALENNTGDHIISISKMYLTLLDEHQAVDFSGLLHKTYLVLKNNPDLVKRVSGNFKYILMDEAQDTNTVQLEILKFLGCHGNVFAVGDEAQSIYKFRCACPENMIKFKKHFKGCKEVNLPRNYRSTAKILEAAESVIKNNSTSKDTVLIAERGDGNPVVVKDHIDQDNESWWIANKIQEFIAEGISCSEIAILYRINSLSRTLEEKLRSYNIPYKISGGFSFYDRAEIKTAVDGYFSFFANPNNALAFERAITNPSRQVGEGLIGKIENIKRDQGISITEACKQVDTLPRTSAAAKKGIKEFMEIYRDCWESKGTVSEIAEALLKNSGYYKYLENQSFTDRDSEKRLSNIDELLLSVKEYEKDNPGKKLFDYLDSVKLMSSDDSAKDEDTVSLSTMHAAKGLEFKVVFLAGIEDDIIPHLRAVTQEEREEERRLFYVAMTRAKDSLFISFCRNRRTYKYTKPKFPSQFIDEMKICQEI